MQRQLAEAAYRISREAWLCRRMLQVDPSLVLVHPWFVIHSEHAKQLFVCAVQM